MKKDSIQTRKRKPKGQGKNKKVSRRQTVSAESHQSEGYSAATPTATTDSPSSASESTRHSNTETTSGNPSSVPYFGSHSNSLRYQRESTQHSTDNSTGLTESSATTPSGLDHTMSDVPNRSPRCQQSACAIDNIASNQTNEMKPMVSAITHSSVPDSFSPTVGYTSSAHNGSYDSGYTSIIHSGNGASSSITDVGSSSIYGPYSSEWQQLRAGQGSGTLEPSTSIGPNFLASTMFNERPGSLAENYRLMLSSGYTGSDSSALASSRLYRPMQNEPTPYPGGHYVEGNSSARS